MTQLPNLISSNISGYKVCWSTFHQIMVKHSIPDVKPYIYIYCTKSISCCVAGYLHGRWPEWVWSGSSSIRKIKTIYSMGFGQIYEICINEKFLLTYDVSPCMFISLFSLYCDQRTDMDTSLGRLLNDLAKHMRSYPHVMGSRFRQIFERPNFFFTYSTLILYKKYVEISTIG